MSRFDSLIEDMKWRQENGQPESAKYFKVKYQLSGQAFALAKSMYPKAAMDGRICTKSDTGMLQVVSHSGQGTRLILCKGILKHLGAQKIGTRIAYRVENNELILKVAK